MDAGDGVGGLRGGDASGESLWAPPWLLPLFIEPAPEGGFWAICLEIPGANGQGETVEEARTDLQAAIELLLEDREADISRGLPPDAVRMPLHIG